MTTEFFPGNDKVPNRNVNTGALITATAFGTIAVFIILILLVNPLTPFGTMVLLTAAVIFALIGLFCLAASLNQKIFRDTQSILDFKVRQCDRFFETHKIATWICVIGSTAVSLAGIYASLYMFALMPRDYYNYAFPIFIASLFFLTPLLAKMNTEG